MVGLLALNQDNARSSRAARSKLQRRIMTNNEKAATFIDWVPLCGGPDPKGIYGICKHNKSISHVILAPDMTLANNWEKVIENYLIPKLYMISFYKGESFICSIKIWHQIDIPDKWKDKYIMAESAKSLGDAIVLALVKLYDIKQSFNEEIS